MIEIFNADFRDKIKEIDNESVDIIFTDPPYLTNTKRIKRNDRAREKERPAELRMYNDNFKCVDNKEMIRDFFRESFRIIKTNGILLIFLSWTRLDFFITEAKNVGWHFYYFVTWKKNNVKCNQQFHTNPDTRCEYILAFYKKEHRKYAEDSYLCDILEFENVSSSCRNHPNQKPARLLNHFIHLYKNKTGKTKVVDCFMGGGSLGKVCSQYDDIDYIGTEKDPYFFKQAKDFIYDNNVSHYLYKGVELPIINILNNEGGNENG